MIDYDGILNLLIIFDPRSPIPKLSFLINEKPLLDNIFHARNSQSHVPMFLLQAHSSLVLCFHGQYRPYKLQVGCIMHDSFEHDHQPPPALLKMKPSPVTSVAFGLITVAPYTYNRLKKDRWKSVRCHKSAIIRRLHKTLTIYQLAWRIEEAYSKLPPPLDALEFYPGSSKILEDVIANGPKTWQSKPKNVAQIKSLMNCVCQLVPVVVQRNIDINSASDNSITTTTPLVLDIGAGKALFTRAIYEALDRKVAVVALDSRRARKGVGKAKRGDQGDQFYDPCEDTATAIAHEDAPYTRIVADVRYLAARTMIPLKKSKDGGVIAITKHLCGGATDGSIQALCKSPLANFVGACCFAPCCHQKLKREQYCNIPYLESLGFCKTHEGVRGQGKGTMQDHDFGTLKMLISISKADHLQEEWEYSNKQLPKILGFSRAKILGRKVRRILEEGRMEYLRERGFDSHLVRYCGNDITCDNLAIIATKRGIE